MALTLIKNSLPTFNTPPPATISLNLYGYYPIIETLPATSDIDNDPVTISVSGTLAYVAFAGSDLTFS